MKKIIAGIGSICMMFALVSPGLAMPGAEAQKKGGNSQAAQAGISGKVAETMDSGGYTYVLLEDKGKKTWIALPQTKVAKGKTITVKPGMEMKNFESKTLKRKFDTIIFSDGVIK